MGAGSSTKKRVAPSESLHNVGAGCGGGEVGIRHLKMNHAMFMKELKSLWASGDQEVPMRLIPLLVLEGQKKLRRTRTARNVGQDVRKAAAGKLTLGLGDIPGCSHIVYIGGQIGKDEDKQKDGAMADGAWGSSDWHKMACKALRKLAALKNWKLSAVYVWIPPLCKDEEDKRLQAKVVESLRAYMAVCSAMLVPSPQVPPEGACALNQVPGKPRDNSLAMLEAMCFHGVSSITGNGTPEIWVAANYPSEEASESDASATSVSKKYRSWGSGGNLKGGVVSTEVADINSDVFLEPFIHTLHKLPSEGALDEEEEHLADVIKQQETEILRTMRGVAAKRGFATMMAGYAMCVAEHPVDDQYVAVGGQLGEMRIVCRETGYVKHIWRTPAKPDGAPRGSVNCLKWSPMGDMLISGDSDHNVTVWDIVSGENPSIVAILKSHVGSVLAVAMSSSSDRIASAGWDHTVKIWGKSGENWAGIMPSSQKELWGPTGNHAWNEVCTLRGPKGEVTSVCFSKSGDQVIGGSADGSIFVWRLGDQCQESEPVCYVAHEGGVNALAMSPDCSVLASGGADGAIKIWNVSSGSPKVAGGGSPMPEGGSSMLGLVSGRTTVRSPKGGLEGPVGGTTGNSSPFKGSPKGRGGGGGGDTSLEEYLTEKALFVGHAGPILSLAFSPDGSTVASGHMNHSIKVWDTSQSTKLLRSSSFGLLDSHKEVAPLHMLPGNTGEVRSVAYSHNGSYIVSVGSGPMVKVWIITPGHEPRCGQTQVARAHDGPVTSIAFSNLDSRSLATCGAEDGHVRVWGVVDDVPVQKLTLHRHVGKDSALVWSRDSNVIATTGPGVFGPNVALWNSETGHRKRWWQWRVMAGLDQGLKELVSVARRDAKLRRQQHHNSRIADSMREVIMGNFMVTANYGPRDVVRIYDLNSATDEHKQATYDSARGDTSNSRKGARLAYSFWAESPLASFTVPSEVQSLQCKGTFVCVGCTDGQLLLLEAPILAEVQL